MEVQFNFYFPSLYYIQQEYRECTWRQEQPGHKRDRETEKKKQRERQGDMQI